MTGKATSAGIQYQAHAIASLYVDVIVGNRVSWFGPIDRLATAVWGETRGPGDDLRIEFDTGPIAEAQVRHDMNAAGDLASLVADIRSRSAETGPIPVALIVPSTVSRALLTTVPKDLDRLREGRDDELHAEVKSLLTDPDSRGALERLYVVAADFDEPHSTHRLMAVDRLARRLVDSSRASAAFAELVADALDISANAGRRNRDYLVELLEARGYGLKPPERDERWVQELDWITDFLLEGDYDQVAFDRLVALDDALRRADASPRIRARSARLRTVALLRLERVDDALQAAEETLAYDSGWSEGLEIAARAGVIAKDYEVAAARADRAIKADQGNAKAWAVKALLAAATASSLPTAPAMVSDHPDYLHALLDNAASRGDTSAVLELTERLLARSRVRPQVRFVRGQALLYVGDRTSGAAQREAWLSADAVLSAVVDELRVGHPLLAVAYAIRSEVRQRLDRADDAEADLAAAQRAGTGGPEVVEQIARSHAARGRFDASLRVLQAPLVDQFPHLLAMRADLLAAVGRPAEARGHLDRALALVAVTGQADPALASIARSALLLDDSKLASTAFTQMTDAGRAGWEGRVLAADLAFADGDVDQGVALYRDAASTAPDSRRVLLNLALRLLEADRAEEAQAAFEETSVDKLTVVELHPYAVAAFRARDLAAAQAVVDRVALQGPLPEWALKMAADIALRRGDPEAAARHLFALDAQAAGSARVHIVLARCLIEIGQEDRAREHVLLVADRSPTPRERSDSALILKEVGLPEAALREAFRAYREDRGDPQVQTALALLTFTAGARLDRPDTVGPNSHVRLRGARGGTREHSIFADAPISKAAGELTLEEASAAGILGGRVGGVIERDAGHWSRQQWTIEEIVPAEVHAAGVIAETFSDLFPDQPSPFWTVPVGRDEDPAAWTHLIQLLGERQKFAAALLALYHEKVPSIEFVATMMHVAVPELMRAAGVDPLVRPLLVEWSDSPSYDASVEAAVEARTLVLARSALATIQRLGLLDLVRARYKVIVPMSLRWQLRVEVAEARKQLASGISTIALAGHGPHIADVPAGDPQLQAQVEALESALGWIEASARVEPRPLDAVSRPEADHERLREQLGPSGSDAVELARSGLGRLLADDLGLRRLLGGADARSVSTIAVLDALAESEQLTNDDRDRLLVDLVLGGYQYVRPTSGVLAETLRRMPGLGRESLFSVFSLLGGPLITAQQAAGLTAGAIKAMAGAAIATTRVEVVAEAAMRGMSSRWPRQLAARLIVRAAERELRLYPSRHLQLVNRVCAEITAEGIVRI